MKKRDKKQQAKLEKATTKRAVYTKARKQKLPGTKRKPTLPGLK